MAFPVVEDREFGSTTVNATTHSITFPAGIVAGELLLAFVSIDGTQTTADNEGRWTKIAGQQKNGSIVTGAVFAKIAEASGSADDLTVISANEQASWVTFRISGHGGLPTASMANGSSTNSNPPSHTPPYGAQDYLWIVSRHGDGATGVTAGNQPANYSNLTGVTHANAGGASTHTAERELNASSTDPGTFTSALEQWATFTVAVPPADMPFPRLKQVYYKDNGTAGTTSLVSDSFTPADGEVIVVKAATNDSGTVIGSISGGSLSWTRQSSTTSGSFCYTVLDTAVVGSSPGSMTVTVPFSGDAGLRAMVVERWELAQLDATPAVNGTKTGSGAPSATVTTEAANSVVTWVNSDWNVVDPGAYAYRSATTVEDAIAVLDNGSLSFTWYGAYQYAPSTGAQTIGLSAPAGQAWALHGVEIQYLAPAGGGGDPVTVRSAEGASGAEAADPAVVTKPAGLAVGDLMIAISVGDNDGTLATMTGPSGFTTIGSEAEIGESPSVKVWSKVADSADVAAADFSFEAGSGVFCSAGIIAIEAGTYDDADPIHLGPTFNSQGTNSTTHTAPSLASGVDGGLLITGHSTDQGGAGSTSYTPPSGMTEEVDTAASSGFSALEMCTLALTGTSATGTKGATCTANRPSTSVSLIIAPAAGATEYPVSVSGTITSSAALVRRPGKVLAGSSSSSGALTRQTGKRPAGTLTPAGALARRVGKTLAGTGTPAGALLRATQKALSGSATPAGALARAVTRVVALGGTVASTGAAQRRLDRTLAGTVAAAGALVRSTAKTVSGVASSSGELATVRSRLLAVAGTLASSGALVRRPGKVLAGTSSSAGSLVRRTGKVLAGAVSSSGAVASIRSRLLAVAGAIASSGALARSTSKTLTGSSSPAGTVTRSAGRLLSGVVGPAGELVRQTGKTLAGAAASSGAVASIRSRLLAVAGSLAPSGNLARSTAKTLAGAASSSGALTRRTGKTFAGELEPAAAVATVRAVLLALAGALTPAGAVTRSVAKTFAGAAASSGETVKLVARELAGTIASSGAVTSAKAIVISLAGAIAAAGSLVRELIPGAPGDAGPVHAGPPTQTTGGIHAGAPVVVVSSSHAGSPAPAVSSSHAGDPTAAAAAAHAGDPTEEGSGVHAGTPN